MGKIFKALEKSKNHINVEQIVADRETVEKKAPISKASISAGNLEKPKTVLTIDNNNKPLPDFIDPGLITALKPNCVESEQFRLLKNSILFPDKRLPPRSIMVTSSAPSEGKSFVSANLAVSIAQNIDEHVLLIDCDLRKPTIHKLFGFDAVEGLSEYLSRAKPLSSLLSKTFLDKLTILPGGTIPENPSELLSSEQMRRLIKEVQSRYSDRYIIIDTPPPYITSETNALARQVDGIVLVIKEGFTQMRGVQNIIDIYGRDKILGVVQNFSKIPFGSKYGKYGYGYYGSYGEK